MNKNNLYTLTPISFAKIFNVRQDKLPPFVVQKINKTNFGYTILEGEKYDEAILRIIKTLDANNLKTSGPHRLADWEKGWRENFQEYKKFDFDLHHLIPKFVKRHEYIRFQGNLIDPQSDSFETDFVTVMRCYLFNTYYKDAHTLYEFGAGTGLNLVAASKIFPDMKFVGLDWAHSSVQIINALKRKLNISISGNRFDLFNPDNTYRLAKNSAVLTIGTLEQLGRNFKPFIKYLLRNKPNICIHMETLYEVYNKDDILDYLAIKYLEQRNYLKGFLPYLKNLEAEKRIKILEVRRTFGSFYHEGYTYIVWKPI